MSTYLYSRENPEVRKDRLQRYEQRRAKVLRDIDDIQSKIIQEAIDLSEAVKATPAWTPDAKEVIRNAAKIHALWSYVDGVIVGMCTDVMSSAELEVRRRNWNESCDEKFGDFVGKTLMFH